MDHDFSFIMAHGFRLKRLVIRIKRLVVTATAPMFMTNGAAGADLFAAEDAELPSPVSFGRYMPQLPIHVHTGWALQMPFGYEGQIRGRSSLARMGIMVHVGTIDADYRGAIGVLMYNVGPNTHVIHVGDRIAQIIFAPVVRPRLRIAEVLSETQRGEGGYGSTGR
jgi:dUTP pyrophosphatase